METKVTNFSRTLHLCSNDHDEVCFSGDKCPVCAERGKREDIELDVLPRLDVLESALLSHGKTMKTWVQLADNFREIESAKKFKRTRK